jgi:hypothetical protein
MQKHSYNPYQARERARGGAWEPNQQQQQQAAHTRLTAGQISMFLEPQHGDPEKKVSHITQIVSGVYLACSLAIRQQTSPGADACPLACSDLEA